MRSWEKALRRIEEFFIQLFPGAQAGKDNRNIFDSSPRQADKSARQVRDADRFSHIEHQDISVSGNGKGLEHERNGFGYGHEITRDLRVGYGDAPLAADLLLEDRYNTALRAENIAKTYG